MCEHAENREICLKKAKSGETLAKALAMLTGKLFVCGKVATD